MTLNRFRLVLLIVSVVLSPVWAGRAYGQSTALLTVEVTDTTDAPLEGVQVALSGAVFKAVRSDEHGRLAFEGLPAGDYELTAESIDFAPIRRTVRLAAGERLNLALTLQIWVQEQTVVTATKAGGHEAEEAPMAVSVLKGAALQQQEAHTVAQLAGLAPSVTFSQNSDFAQLTIRGIGSNTVFAGTDPSSALYVDGVYISRPVMVLGDFVGVDRVEVLRGPQGTLYGRNALGGVLNVITQGPTAELDASARFVAGNLGLLRSEARVSGPLIRNRAFGSVAILSGVRDGFVRDVDHPDHPLGGEDVSAVQAKLRAVLSRRTTLMAIADLTKQDPTPLTYAKVLSVKPGFQIDNPSGLRSVRASTLAEGEILQYGTALRLDTRLAATTISSVTAFRSLDYEVVNDADISELDLTAVRLQEKHHQWSEELTISQQRSRLRWIGGLFVFDENDYQPTAIRLGGPRLESVLDPRVDASATAVFGQITYDVTARLAATGGLRYTSERKSIDNAGQLSALDPPFSVVPGSQYAYTDAIAHTGWMPKFGLEIRPRSGLLAYASATRGFKTGGFNFTTQVAGRGYAPESAWSYEAGAKIERKEGRTRVNAALFYTDYSDLQVQTAIQPGVIDISNAAEATIRGVEVEAATELGRPVQVGGHFAWLDARYDRYIATGVGGVTGDVAGLRLTNAPEWSGRLWAQWTLPVGRAGRLTTRADARYQSIVFFTPFNDAIQRQPAYGLLDMTAEFTPSRRRWTIGVWMRNLGNTDYITGSFGTPLPAIGGRPGEPRQAGIQFTIRL